MDVYVRGKKHERFTPRINVDLSCLQIKGEIVLTLKVSILIKHKLPYSKNSCRKNPKKHYSQQKLAYSVKPGAISTFLLFTSLISAL